MYRVRSALGCGMLAALLFGALGWFATPARADNPPPASPSGVSFEQKLDAQVPLDLTFRDDSGQTVKLSDYFGSKPVVLTLNYFHCPNLCTLELDQLANSMSDLPFSLGKDFNVVTVSIDPRETPDIAAQKKWQYVRVLARPGVEEGWKFLTGNQAAITALTAAVGFHYLYDAASDEFEHPTGIVVLTPQGKVSRYLYGVDFPSTDLRLALVEASQNKIGSLVDQVLLYCYHYDPTTGRYSPLIMNIMRLSGAITVFALGGFVIFLFRQDVKRKA